MTVTEGEEDREKVTNATIEQIKKEEEEDTEKVSNATIEQIKKEEEDDREKASNATIEQIKKEDEEEEEEIGQIKKEDEEEREEEIDLDLLSNVPDGFKGLMDALLNVFLEQSEGSTKEMEESEAKTRKNARIVESEEAKTGSGPAVDPLDITLEMVSKCEDFLDYVLEMLKEKRKDEGETLIQGWSKALERGKHLVESLKHRMNRLPDEMERMKNDMNLQKEYSFRITHLEDVLAHLRDLISSLNSTTCIRVGSGVNYVKHVLPFCLDELERFKDELSDLTEVIIELKGMNKEEDEDEYMRRKMMNNQE